MKDFYPSCSEEIIQRKAVRLGVQSQVGGKWRSFVAVSENENMGMRPSEDDLQNVEPPVQARTASFGGSESCASAGIESEEAEESDGDMGFALFESSLPRTLTPANGADMSSSSHYIEDMERVRPGEGAEAAVVNPLS